MMQISLHSDRLPVAPAGSTPASSVWRRPWRGMVVVVALLLLLLQAAPVRACALDGIASLSANGVTAGLTSGQATATTLAYWAPFTLLAVSPDTSLRLTENMTNVRQSLPAALLKQPFRWTFGDGAVAYGFTVTHRYARPGWYRITVSYNWAARDRWILFDRAEQQVVASGDLWKTNFGYYLGNVLQMALRLAIWGVALIVVGAFIWDRLVRAKAR